MMPMLTGVQYFSAMGIKYSNKTFKVFGQSVT